MAIMVPLNNILGIAGHIDLALSHRSELSAAFNSFLSWSEHHTSEIQLFIIISGVLLFLLGPTISNRIKTASPFLIEFNPMDSVFSNSIPNEHFIEQVKRIRVKNTYKDRSIGAVKVTLNNVTPEPNLMYAFPVPLRFTNDQKPPYDQFRFLNEGEGVFVDVISYKHSSELPIGKAQLHVEHSKSDQSQMIPNGDFEFEIKAEGSGVHEKTAHFNIQMKKQCILMTKIKEENVVRSLWWKLCEKFGQLKRKLPLHSARKAKLWAMRTEGVALRNELVDHWSYPEWKERFEEWHKELLLEAEKISGGLRSYLGTLDQCTQPDLGIPANREHEHDLKILSEVLFRLQKFLEGGILKL